MTEGIAERTQKGVGRFNLYDPDFLLLVVDLIGTFVFAVEGALAGINADLDVFGLLVPRDIPVTLAPREHTRHVWLP